MLGLVMCSCAYIGEVHVYPGAAGVALERQLISGWLDFSLLEAEDCTKYNNV